MEIEYYKKHHTSKSQKYLELHIDPVTEPDLESNDEISLTATNLKEEIMSDTEPENKLQFKSNLNLSSRSNEVIKCGEIITYNSDNFFYLCKFCNIEISINSSIDFLQHIKDDILNESLNIEYLDEIDVIDVNQIKCEKSETIKIEKIDIFESNSSNSDNEVNSTQSEGNEIILKKRKTNLDEDQLDKWRSGTKGNYVCPICDKQFCRLRSFNDHQNTHSGDKPHKCELCNVSYKHQTTLSNHMRIHKNPNSEICKKCKRAYIKGKYHSCLIINVLPKNKYNSECVCTKCDETFASEINLKEHNIHVHNAPGYPCDFCGKILKYRQSYRDHITEHSSETYSCTECDRIFKRRDTLKSHIVKEHLKRHECKFCNKTCYSAADLRAHESMHTGIKSLQCEICGRKFPRNNQLKLHIQRHLNLLEYHCEQCPKKFNTERQLTEHKLWHSDKRNYHCKTCPKSFKTSNSLRRHIKIHNKEPKYHCVFCNDNFTLRTKLTEHIKLVHDKCRLILTN